MKHIALGLALVAPLTFAADLRHEEWQKELGITLGKTPLAEVPKTLGAAKVITTGDASTSLHTLCYTGKDGAVLVLRSEEMDGGAVGHAELFRDKKEAPAIPCVSSKLVNKTLKTSSGLHLGMSRAEIEKALGKPAKGTLYRFEKKSGDCTEWEEIDVRSERLALRKGSYC